MVLNVGHRGASGLAPENTMSAFRKALELGVDMIELDVRITKDKRFVVIHDPTTKRTGTRNRKISRTTWQDLCTIDVGRRFSKDFKNERIPLLRDVIALVGNRALVNIELKGRFYGYEEKLLQLIVHGGIHKSVILASRNKRLLTRLRMLDEDVRLSYIINKPQRRYVQFGRKLGLYSFQVYWKLVTKRFVRNCHQHKCKVFVWTVNPITLMEKMARCGVDGIITNYPNRLNEFIEAWEQ
jgi:glycerophosphoryl diester phosphodiesterase